MHTVESLCERHGVDMAHARCVAAMSARLFDDVYDLHQLPARARELLRAGAYLHNVALHIDAAQHHVLGRDIVLAAPLRDFSPAERAVLACEVAFHEQIAQPATDDLFKALNSDQQRAALVLSAILRVADGLDSSGTQTTALASVQRELRPNAASAAGWVLHVAAVGPHSHEDAAAADRKADLWRALLGGIEFTGRVASPGLTPDMPLVEAGRRVLAYRFDRSGGRRAWDAIGRGEGSARQIRKLRVTVRRMRADLRLFGAAYRGKALRPIEEGLREWSAALRKVRTYDALLDNLTQYLERCDDEANAGLYPLLNDWQAARDAADAQLRALARGDDGQEWLDALEAFLRGEGSRGAARQLDPGEPSRVRHVADLAVWHGLAGVRTFDVLPDTPSPLELHAFRLAVKRLRYTVESLADVMPGDDVRAWLSRCILAQDALGAIQDAHVAATYAQDYASHRKRPARATQQLAVKGIVTYAEAQRKVIDARATAWRDYLQPFL